MPNKLNPLVSLSLFDWQKGVFALTLSLDRMNAELANMPPITAGQDPVTIEGGEKIDVVVTDLNNVETGKATIAISDPKDLSQAIFIPAMDNAIVQPYLVKVFLQKPIPGTADPKRFEFAAVKIQVPEKVASNQPIQVNLGPTSFEYTPSVDLWAAIKNSRVAFINLKQFVDTVLCKPVNNFGPAGASFDTDQRKQAKLRLPFVNVDEYSLIKYAIDAYLRKALKLENQVGNYSLNPLPYYQNLQESLAELLADKYEKGTDCEVLAVGRRNGFLAIELIWSYWMEQAMLVQGMGAISLRFQNIRGLHAIEPMMRFDTSPLLPLSNLLWGYVQDEQHRTSLHRRSFEYQHAYNLILLGKAVPPMRGVDNRSHFLNAFHNLLYQASLFYKDLDDTTRQADAFPLLVALRDVHFLLAEGNHNAYFNMTYTARHEMLTMMYLMSQPEMQIFLGGRPMMPYEPFMGTLDTIKTVQGWDPVGTMHYYELANTGEQILLGVRFGDWANSMFTAQDAGNWAISFRDLISTYINAYRNVSMVDLSSDALRSSMEERAVQPALLIQRRMSMTGANRPALRPQMAIVREY